MNLFNDLYQIQRLDYLIRSRATGTPNELASRLDTCRRNTLRLIASLRDMGLPVAYDKFRRTYYYAEDVKIRFEVIVGKDALLKIQGGAGNHWEKINRVPNFGACPEDLCHAFFIE